jgi:hypothetical protein
MTSFIICIPRHLDDQIEDNEMGRLFDTHGRDEKCLQNLGRKVWMEEET